MAAHQRRRGETDPSAITDPPRFHLPRPNTRGAFLAAQTDVFSRRPKSTTNQVLVGLGANPEEHHQSGTHLTTLPRVFTLVPFPTDSWRKYIVCLSCCSVELHAAKNATTAFNERSVRQSRMQITKSFSLVPECVVADCWNRAFPTPRCIRPPLLLLVVMLYSTRLNKKAKK